MRKQRREENIELSPRKISNFEFDVEWSLEDRQNVILRVKFYERLCSYDFSVEFSMGKYLIDDAWKLKELEEQMSIILFIHVKLPWCCIHLNGCCKPTLCRVWLHVSSWTKLRFQDRANQFKTWEAHKFCRPQMSTNKNLWDFFSLINR